ncbi:MAG TPA: HAMP domain-containing histidine kinase [Helicobacteraceae bacterium]|nr:HAMP domain-containing histidine kinase [Helicobacteraceae bacterium]
MPIFKHSILNTVRSIGVLGAILLILVAIFTAYFIIFLDKKHAVEQSIMLYDHLMRDVVCDDTMKMYLNANNLTKVEESYAQMVMGKNNYLISDEAIRKTFKNSNIEIFIFDNHYYYGYKAHGAMLYFKNNTPITPYALYITLITLFLLIILYFLYRTISRSIAPLKSLSQKITLFAQGEKDVHLQVEGDDEVANVAKAFNAASSKITSLQQSRILFLRNIMHELKTPITRGKLLSFMLDQRCEDLSKLSHTFDLMEAQLKELSDVEALTSHSVQITIHNYPMIDMLDNALELLNFDENQLVHNIASQFINADFNLFTTVIKNLLDNARKYTQTYPIYIEMTKTSIIFKNSGNPLAHPIEHYMKPFSRDDAHQTVEGFGLGLYITNEILKRHAYHLEYRYEDSMHCFIIKYN